MDRRRTMSVVLVKKELIQKLFKHALCENNTVYTFGHYGHIENDVSIIKEDIIKLRDGSYTDIAYIPYSNEFCKKLMPVLMEIEGINIEICCKLFTKDELQLIFNDISNVGFNGTFLYDTSTKQWV